MVNLNLYEVSFNIHARGQEWNFSTAVEATNEAAAVDFVISIIPLDGISTETLWNSADVKKISI